MCSGFVNHRLQVQVLSEAPHFPTAMKKKTKTKRKAIRTAKPKLKKKLSLGSQLMVASTIFWAGNSYIISQVDSEEDDKGEAVVIKAVRFKPIHF